MFSIQLLSISVGRSRKYVDKQLSHCEKCHLLESKSRSVSEAISKSIYSLENTAIVENPRAYMVVIDVEEF